MGWLRPIARSAASPAQAASVVIVFLVRMRIGARACEWVPRIAQIVEDIGRMTSPPQFLEQPVYPVGENTALLRELDLVEKERPDLPQAYHLMFADFRSRLKSDNTRELRRIATTALLTLATPALSGFMVSYYLGPYYERENRRDIAAAVYEEALKWETDPSDRRDLQQKINALRTPTAK